MSILIKREMPKGCWACPFAVGKLYECLFTKKSYNWGLTTRPSDCPLIEVKSPHGRLVDADAFDERVRVAGGMSEEELTEDFKDGVQTVLYMLSKQPPIIEAEGSENENHNV